MPLINGLPGGTPGLGTFWESQGENTGDTADYEPVLKQTSGFQADIPYHYLPGSDVGTTSQINDVNAQSLFPTYNGTTALLPHPRNPVNPDELDPDFEAAFATEPADLDPDIFLSWHSAYQLEYIATKGLETTAPVRKYVTIGTNVTLQTITATTSTDGLRVFILENLQKRDFATMSVDDQAGLVVVPGASARLATFGLTTDQGLVLNGNDSLPTGDPNKLGLNDIRAIITNLAPDANLPAGLMTLEDRKLFLDQIDNLITKVNRMRVFSMTDIINQATEISARFERAYYFAQEFQGPFGGTGETTIRHNPDVPTEAAKDDPKQWLGVISLDEGATVKQGYKVFIEQEKQILARDNERKALSETGTIKDKRLDVPSLVFLFQMQYNLTVEAKSVAETQEINQQNDLLKTYSEMQRIISDTIKAYNNDSEATKSLFGNAGAAPTSNLSAYFKTISMFEDALGTTRHPLEILRKITRPTDNMYDNAGKLLNGYKKAHWDIFAGQLADTVTLINQESQIKMNDINSMDKQKNRHFDLANSALSKLNDMLQNIARAG